MTDLSKDDVRKVVSVHGHPFQYAVLRRGEQLNAEGRSRWVFEAAEFPVKAGDSVIHIDFLLHGRDREIYLVAECKRADPARSRWCFIQAPFTRRNASPDELFFQSVSLREGTPLSSAVSKSASIGATHLGFELRTDAKGDGISSKSAIGEATAQVLRGVNGLIDHLYGPGTTRDNPAIFLPVIFTTAELWLADGDLASADITTGVLPQDWSTLKRVPWLWYTYNQSPALRHGIPTAPSKLSPTISRALAAEYSRTIAVVGSDGIDAFLGADLVYWL